MGINKITPISNTSAIQKLSREVLYAQPKTACHRMRQHFIQAQIVIFPFLTS